MFRQILHHLSDDGQGSVLLLRIDGGIDAVESHILVVGHIGVDGVAQPTLLPYFLKQSGGAAASQQGVEQQELIPARVKIVHGGEAQNQMVLLNGFAAGSDCAFVPAGSLKDGVSRLHASQNGQNFIHLTLGKAACQCRHHIAGTVVGAMPLAQGIPCHGGQGGLRAQNGASQSAALIDRSGQALGHQILRGVLVHSDLFQNDPSFGLYVGLIEVGVEEHIAQNIQCLRQVPIQTAGVKAGVFFGGVGVDLAADGIHVFGQLGSSAALSALEKHMLNKVGRTVFLWGFVAGACPDKKAQSGGTGAGDCLGEQAGTVFQFDLLIHGILLRK